MKFSFKELINVVKLQELTDELYLATSIPSAIVSMDGEVLTKSGWQRICTDFHSQHPETQKDCFESDIKTREKSAGSESFAIYKCPRGMVEASSPIIIAGEHIANIFSGQIFLQPPKETTEQFFREQARKFGFDETEYIRAFKEVPVLTEKIFRSGTTLLAKFAQMIADMGFARLNELQSIDMLRENEAKYRNIFENAIEGFFQSTPEGRFISVNPAFVKILGYASSEELISSNFDIGTQYYVDKEDRHRYKQLLQEAGSLKNFEYRAQCKDGSHIWISASTRIVYDPNGKVVRYEGNITDITDRIQSERALKESEARLKKAQSVAKIGNWEYDIVKGSIWGSEQAFQLYGLDRTSPYLPLDKVEACIPDVQRVNQALVDLIQKNEKYDIEFEVHRKVDGKIILIHSIAELIFNNETPIKVLGIIHDITEQKKLEVQLLQAQKMESIGTLAGGIAHDFNNILFPIVGHTEMLLEDAPEGNPFRASLEAIYTSALRAKDLVQQILTFSRQDDDELRLMKMQPIVKEALQLIRATIPTTIEIKQNIHSNCSVIKADPTQIHQIVMNLATNAFHAMEETGGELIVSLKEIVLGTLDMMNPGMTPGVYACLTIAGTGKGMNKELIQKIFDPFFTTKERGKGTGMGLSVVHGIVISMNGAIQAYSEPEKGSEFKVYLPVSKAFSEKQVINPKPKVQGGTEQIFIIDDEKAILTMEKQMLERLGYQVTTCTSSIKALEIYRADPDKFDLIISDIAMPNMSGDKLSVELTKIRPDIPILLCTGFSGIISEEKAASMGINGFLLKPITTEDLSNKIREVLDEEKNVENFDH